MRNLARIVTVDGISPIEGADAIEAAHVGGWKVVVKKSEFKIGDLAIYFEIDSFLPEGNPAWQFLVDKSPRVFEERRGHVLRSVKLRGQISQGLLLGTNALVNTPAANESLNPGANVSDALGVLKYERPIPACLAGMVRGNFPSRVPKTDQERIQNLAEDLDLWQTQLMAWEVTEKLEGASCTWAWLNQELHVCSRTLDLSETEGNSFWRVARDRDIASKLRSFAGARNLAMQGELIGFGIQDNIYGLKGQDFYLFDVYDVDAGRYWSASERLTLAEQLTLPHVPVIQKSFVLSPAMTMEKLLTMADGESMLKTGQRREGLVFKALETQVSFKAISNQYLLKQKSQSV